MRVQKNEIFFGLGLTRAGDSVPSETAGGTTVEPDKVNGDTVLSADEVNNLMLRFAVKIYKVTFYNPDVAYQYVEYGRKLTEVEPIYDEERLIFCGWYTEDNQKYDFSTPVKSEFNLYAKLESKKYNVTFDTNGGSEAASQVVLWGENASQPETAPVKEGYTFAGWYSDKECTIPYDFSKEIKEDTTIYAKWTINTYKVSFDTNGGSGVSTQTVEWNKAATKPETEPAKEGYTFAGWYADKDCNTEYDFKTAVKTDVTIYAKWTINSYKVTFE